MEIVQYVEIAIAWSVKIISVFLLSVKCPENIGRLGQENIRDSEIEDLSLRKCERFANLST